MFAVLRSGFTKSVSIVNDVFKDNSNISVLVKMVGEYVVSINVKGGSKEVLLRKSMILKLDGSEEVSIVNVFDDLKRNVSNELNRMLANLMRVIEDCERVDADVSIETIVHDS